MDKQEWLKVTVKTADGYNNTYIDSSNILYFCPLTSKDRRWFEDEDQSLIKFTTGERMVVYHTPEMICKKLWLNSSPYFG